MSPTVLLRCARICIQRLALLLPLPQILQVLHHGFASASGRRSSSSSTSEHDGRPPHPPALPYYCSRHGRVGPRSSAGEPHQLLLPPPAPRSPVLRRGPCVVFAPLLAREAERRAKRPGRLELAPAPGHRARARARAARWAILRARTRTGAGMGTGEHGRARALPRSRV